MEIPPLNENEKWKGQMAGSWHARKQVQLARDGQLIADVNRWGVMTIELGCALLGLPRTTSNLRIVETRYRKLSAYQFHQIAQGGTTYYVPSHTSKGKAERAQLVHKLMDVRASSTLLRVQPIQEYLNGKALWERDRMYTPNLIPDAFFNLDGTEGIFREDETGASDYYKIIPKCFEYYNLQTSLKRDYKIENFIVFWNCKNPEWVERIVKDIHSKLPIDARSLFFVMAEKSIDPFHPQSLLDSIYHSPVDNQQYGFLN